MDKRVIPQLTVPGVEHRRYARERPEVSFVGTKVLDRCGRNLHQQAIQQLFVAMEQCTQLRGRGHDGVKIILRQQLHTYYRSHLSSRAVPLSSQVQQAAMFESALFSESIIPTPYCETNWGLRQRTTSAKSMSAFVGQTLKSTTAGPPFLEETVGGLEKKLTKLVPQRISQMGMDLGRSQARVSE